MAGVASKRTTKRDKGAREVEESKQGLRYQPPKKKTPVGKRPTRPHSHTPKRRSTGTSHTSAPKKAPAAAKRPGRNPDNQSSKPSRDKSAARKRRMAKMLSRAGSER